MPVRAGTVVVDVEFSRGSIARLDSESRKAGINYANTFKRAAFTAVSFIGAAAIGKALFIDPLKDAGQFERTMNVLQAQTGATKDEMAALGKEAIRLGADITLPGTSAQDASEAMLALAKGGLSVKDTMQATRGVLVASAAAQIDNAQAAELVANALNAFSLSGRRAGEVADLLAGAANSATGEMPDFGQALQQVGSSAHALNIPIEDTVTALTELAQAGIVGSDAGTSLKVAFQRLIPSTTKAQAEVKRLGINLFDSEGNFVGLRSSIAQYSKALDKLTPKQRAQAIQTIFGTDAQRAANQIFARGTGVYDKLRDKVTKQGQAAKLARAQNKGLAGAWDGLISTVQTLQLELGEKLAPSMTRLFRALSADLPGAFNTAIAVTEEFGGTVQFLADHIDIIGPSVAGVAAAFVTYKVAVAGVTAVQRTLTGISLALNTAQVLLSGGTSALAAAQAEQAAAAGEAAAAQTVLNSAMLANPFGLAAVGLGILVGGIIAYKSGIGGVFSGTDQMTRAMDDARVAADNLGDALRNLHSDTLDAKQASLDRANAADQLTAAERRVTALVKAGKKGTEEYTRATRDETQARLDLAQAQVRQHDAEQKVAADRAKAREQTRKVVDSINDLNAAAHSQALAQDRLAHGSLVTTTASQLQARMAGIAADQHTRLSAALGTAASKEAELASKLRATNADQAAAHRKTAELDLAAQHLNDTLGRTPTKKEINVFYKHNMAQLREEARLLAGEIAAIPSTKTVSIQFAQGHGTPLARTHAVGGIFTGPTRIGPSDIFGEAGREAVVPLETPFGRRMLSDALRTAIQTVGGLGGSFSFEGDVWLDGQKVGKLVDVRIHRDNERLARNLRAGKNWG